MLGGNLLYSYSRGLGMICLSSGESEFNGGVAAASEALFFKQILEFHGHPVRVNIWLDSSAARGVFQRQGVGRIRHLEAKSLWVQEALRRKDFALHAVGTHENTADIGTKALGEAKLVQHRETLQVWSYEKFMQGRRAEVGSISRVRDRRGFLRGNLQRIEDACSTWHDGVGKGEGGEPGPPGPWGWFQVWMILSLVWTSASMLAALLWVLDKICKSWRPGAQAGREDRIRESGPARSSPMIDGATSPMSSEPNSHES